jgi:hypothetical protein
MVLLIHVAAVRQAGQRGERQQQRHKNRARAQPRSMRT